MPLYMHVVNRVLRELRLRQQQTGESFDYRAFKALLAREDLTDGQRVPLSQRLETLESFMAPPQEANVTQQKKKKKAVAAAAVSKPPGNDWAPRAGQSSPVRAIRSTMTAFEMDTVSDRELMCMTKETLNYRIATTQITNGSFFLSDSSCLSRP